MKTTCSETQATKLASATLPESLVVLAARTACALEQSVQRFVVSGNQNLGHLEDQAARDVQALLREGTQRAAQAKAAASAIAVKSEPPRPSVVNLNLFLNLRPNRITIKNKIKKDHRAAVSHCDRGESCCRTGLLFGNLELLWCLELFPHRRHGSRTSTR